MFALMPTTNLCAQTAAPSPVRSLLANKSLTSVVDAPRYYALFSLKVPASREIVVPGNGFAYVLSGTIAAANGGNRSTIHEGQAIATQMGDTLVSTTDGVGAVVLHFFFGSQSELPVSANPPDLTEIYRTPAPVPNLKSGLYEFTLARVSFPPLMPTNARHHRSGAAIYYVLSGSGSFVVSGKVEPRPTGSVQYEPNDLIHQWGNATDAPLVFLQANISQEGVPPVIFE